MFSNDVANSLGISPKLVNITDIRAGSIIVNFDLLATSTTGAHSASQLSSKMASMIQDTSSPLYTGSVTSTVDRSYAPVTPSPTLPLGGSTMDGDGEKEDSMMMIIIIAASGGVCALSLCGFGVFCCLSFKSDPDGDGQVVLAMVQGSWIGRHWSCLYASEMPKYTLPRHSEIHLHASDAYLTYL